MDIFFPLKGPGFTYQYLSIAHMRIFIFKYMYVSVIHLFIAILV